MRDENGKRAARDVEEVGIKLKNIAQLTINWT
jgi:hypothetical protein